MGLTKLLKKISSELERKNDGLFVFPVDIQRKYLNHFPEPFDDIQRSFFQYKCQMRFYNIFTRIAVTLFSIPLLLYFCVKRKADVNLDACESESVFFSDGLPESVIPDLLRKEVGEILVVNDKNELLTKKDKSFLCSIWKKHPFSMHFLLKCLMKIRYYSYVINSVHPKNIIVCNEYSFTSSVLTKYCNANDIRHINVMHGEKLYYMRDSFFRFDKCFVWDDYYVKLFCEMRAQNDQFVVALPPSFIINNEMQHKTLDYVYYLGGERDDALKIIFNNMLKLQSNGFHVAVRPHPRYTDSKEVEKFSSVFEVEDTSRMTIEESLKRTHNAISLYSTVLNQAFFNNIGIVIDDITDPAKYERLKEIDYIMLNKEHQLLSDLVGAPK